MDFKFLRKNVKRGKFEGIKALRSFKIFFCTDELRKGFYEWLKFSGLVTFGAFVVWKYYQYHERRIKLKENDDEEMYRRSNILNTVNDVIVPWFTIINDLKGKYPVPQLKYKINNVTLSFSKYELIDIVQRTHDVKQVKY